jgi:Fe-S-cluster containining protein
MLLGAVVSIRNSWSRVLPVIARVVWPPAPSIAIQMNPTSRWRFCYFSGTVRGGANGAACIDVRYSFTTKFASTTDSFHTPIAEHELVTDPLPVIQSCDGCGACCMEMGFPPGYQIFLFPPGTAPLGEENADFHRFHAMPSSLAEELRKQFNAGAYGFFRGDRPCVWLDLETRQCKHYEHRPDICRNFEIASPECRKWRVRYQVAKDR